MEEPGGGGLDRLLFRGMRFLYHYVIKADIDDEFLSLSRPRSYGRRPGKERRSGCSLSIYDFAIFISQASPRREMLHRLIRGGWMDLQALLCLRRPKHHSQEPTGFERVPGVCG